MKTIRVGSRSSCPSNQASRAAFTAPAALFGGVRRLFLRVILRRLKNR
jgi:hypothetical protein